jgi:hypothetical protein
MTHDGQDIYQYFTKESVRGRIVAINASGIIAYFKSGYYPYRNNTNWKKLQKISMR